MSGLRKPRIPAGEGFLLSVLQGSSDCIKVLDTSGRMLFINGPGMRLFEAAAPSDLIGSDWAAFWPEPLRDAAREAIRSAAGGRPARFDGACPTLRGTVKRWDNALAPILGDGGQVECIVCISRDVSKRREAEDRLRESEERLARAVAAARMGVWEWHVGTTGEFNACSGLEVLYGMPPGSIRSRVDVHAAIHPDDLPAVNEAMGRSLRGEDGGTFATEFRTLPPNGAVRWLRATGKAEIDGSGRAIRVSGVTQDVTERHEAEARVAYMAHHDALTGLLNRTVLRERLGDALRRSQCGEPCAVLHLDLDRFKEVNDTFGHPVGDELLRSVAKRLLSCVRDGDTVARLGGDEFVILCQGEEQPHAAARLAARVIAELLRPHEIDGRLLSVGVSIGVAVAPEDGHDPAQMMTCADLALYGAKQDGGERFLFFEPEMQARVQARRCLEADLHRALQNREFELHYQPLVNLDRGRISGFEALVRWRHPERGLVGPDTFIPVVEAMGIIVPLGKWILSRACADAASWPDGLKVAVNLSAAQFSDPGLEDAVAAALASSGLAPRRLELEITESLLLQDTKDTIAVLRRLRDSGASISMDDFGTGYASLSYLLKFPIDKVKIDRSFVLAMDERPEGAAIISAVAGLCQTLGIVTTVEGIETIAQLQQVASQGCTEGQGYLFSRPCPAADIPSLLAEWEAKLPI
jgi:diguanylate cyclase (GGDEF)-like protein/PAS domain S-box-containing protein